MMTSLANAVFRLVLEYWPRNVISQRGQSQIAWAVGTV